MFDIDLLDEKQARKLVKELVQKIEHYNYLYYVKSISEISDYEFDQLLVQLKQIETKFPNIKPKNSPNSKVGSSISGTFNKIKHDTNMLSLANAFSYEALIKFDEDIKQTIGNKPFSYCVEPKIDGLSIAIRYKNKKLQLGLTRGDGEYGEDVTQNILQIPSIKKSIDLDKEFELRGEVFLLKKDFELINDALDENQKQFNNARNAASGFLRSINQKESLNRKYLQVYFYNTVNNQNQNINSQKALFKWLDENDFSYCKDIKFANSIDEVIECIKEFEAKRKDFLFNIDGIVIKVNEYNYYEEIGYTSKFPKWAIAYKLQAEIKTSKLLNIITSVGRTGKITYIGQIEPVFLDGTWIKNASLHNFDYINKKDIRINDYINIYKAAEIIPQIQNSIKEKRNGNEVIYKEITNCPSCNSTLVRKDDLVDQFCINELCDEKQILKIVHFASKKAMNISYISEKIIRLLYEHKFIKDCADLYDLEKKEEEILATSVLYEKEDKQINKALFTKKTFTKLYYELNKSKQNSLEKLIFALGIENVGTVLSKVLAKQFKNLNALKNASIDQLVSILEVGDKTAGIVYEWFKDANNILMINKLEKQNINFDYQNEFSNYSVPEKNKKFVGKKIAITGSFSIPRNQITSLLENLYQSQVISSVSKNTDYLLIGKNPTQNKINKANDLKIEIVSDEFFLEYLKQEDTK